MYVRINVRVDQRFGYESTGGLGSNRLKLGYKSTAFGYETTVGTTAFVFLSWLSFAAFCMPITDIVEDLQTWSVRATQIFSCPRQSRHSQERKKELNHIQPSWPQRLFDTERIFINSSAIDPNAAVIKNGQIGYTYNLL